MNRQVFSYKSGAGLGVAVFLYAWGGLWTIGALFGLSNDDTFFAGFRYSVEQVRAFFGWGIAVGLVVVLLATRLILGWLQERIVITDRTVEWHDWLGRKRLRARLSTIQYPVDRQVGYGMSRTSVATDGGTLHFSSLVRGYFDLKLILAEYARSAKKAGEPLGGSWVPTIEPKPREYRYRFGRFHLYATLFLVVIAYMMYQPIASYSEFQQFPFGSPLPSIVFGSICLLVAIRLQLACWLESVKLDGDGIVMRSWNGRVCVRSALAEITGIEEGRNLGIGITRIDSVGGAVRVSSFLVGYHELGGEIRCVLESRKPVANGSSHEPAGR